MSEFLPFWTRLGALGGPGRWLFSRAVGVRAPYFASIRPAVVELAPGHCVVELPKRRRVLNHLGTVHAIACCNAAELAAGMATDATVPRTHRWIPQAMSVRYQAKARTDLRATATVAPLPEPGDTPVEVLVGVDITDTRGEVVVHADITMNVSPRKQAG